MGNDPGSRPPDGRLVLGNILGRRTSFVGREGELRELALALPETRLLTLTGAGGCGKTSLAVEVARQSQIAFTDGAWLAELAPVSDPARVPDTVAVSIGVLGQPGRSFTEVLVKSLRDRRLLLVLDNCEHVLDASAELCDELLRGCADVRILATSRQVLGVEGERTWPVPPLRLPLDADAAAVASSDAGRLFLDRARSVSPRIKIDETNAPAVASICRRLDGMPLAIELAAARVAVLTPLEIDERLHDRFRLLSGGTRVLPRHRTLRALIDWSHDLLAEDEAVLYRRLGVFVGGFTLEAAEDVCSGDPADEAVFETLGHLVEKSLVTVNEEDGRTRYGMLETVREHASERLRAAGEEKELRSRHLAWCCAFVERSEQELRGPRQEGVAPLVDREFGNVRAAFAWSLESNDVEAALRIVGNSRFWQFLQAHGAEGLAWAEAALARAHGADAGLRARALAEAGEFQRVKGDQDRARDYLEQALSIQRELPDTAALGQTLYMLGRAEFAAGRSERARDVTEEGVSLAQSSGDLRGAGERLAQLGEITYEDGRPEQARVLLEDALHLAREAGDRHPIADALRVLGMIERDSGTFDRARSCLWEALGIFRGLADWYCTSLSFSVLGDVALLDGQPGTADALFAESISILRRLDNRHRMADSLWGLAAAAAAQGRPVRAGRLAGAEERFRRETGVPFHLGSVERHDAVVKKLRERKDGDGFDDAWREGLAMSRDEALDYALADHEPSKAFDASSTSPSLSGRFRIAGDVWDIAYAGIATTLRDAKGLRYIHRLLEDTGRELHVSELLVPVSGLAAAPSQPEGRSSLGPGDAGEALDPRAKSEYRRRILDLKEEIDEASRWGDDERRVRAEEELDFISRELAAAFGLGGRARRAGDTSERIRKAVSNRIRDSVVRIGRENPDLGRHLENAISTGTFCSYTPEHTVDWEL